MSFVVDNGLKRLQTIWTIQYTVHNKWFLAFEHLENSNIKDYSYELSLCLLHTQCFDTVIIFPGHIMYESTMS